MEGHGGLTPIEGEGAAGGGRTLATDERVRELTARATESDERHREIISRLKRLLDVERKNLRAVRAAHAKDLQSRTELEVLLRACVDDVRKQLSMTRGAGGATTAAATTQSVASGRPNSASSTRPKEKGSRPSSASGERSARMADVGEFGAKERERTLELLLSQERVVSLLYERTFPARPPTAAMGDVEMEGDDLRVADPELQQILSQ